MAMLWAKIDHPARRGVATTEGLKHSTVSSKANPVLNPGHQSRWLGAYIECRGWLVYLGVPATLEATPKRQYQTVGTRHILRG